MGEVRKRLPDKPEKPRVTLVESPLGFNCTGCLYTESTLGDCAAAFRDAQCMRHQSGAPAHRIFVLKEDKPSTS